MITSEISDHDTNTMIKIFQLDAHGNGFLQVSLLDGPEQKGIAKCQLKERIIATVSLYVLYLFHVETFTSFIPDNA